MESQNKATAAQVRLFKAMFAQAGVALASSRLRRFKALTVGKASLAIQAAKAEFDVYDLESYMPPQGMATAKQLAYFMILSRRLGYRPTGEDIERMKALPVADMQHANNDLMRVVQGRNDRAGVPLPKWRRDRGMFDTQVVDAGQQAAAERRAARRTETDRRILDRQQADPRKAERWATSGGKY